MEIADAYSEDAAQLGQHRSQIDFENDLEVDDVRVYA